MTLYDLATSITIQSNLEINVYNDKGDHIRSHHFRDLDDFNLYHHDVEYLEDAEVTYIYCTKSADGEPWLVIDVAICE